MAASKVDIIIDVKSDSVKFATDKTLGLREQLRLLKKEQSKLLTLGQEGSKEFTILSNAINNTQDDLERSNQKAKDLFATFSLIPGPVGDFAGKVNGALSAMKLLSGFKLSDLKNQFKELGNDIKEIGKNILNFFQKPIKADIKTNINAGAGATGVSAATTKLESAALVDNSLEQKANAGARALNTTSTVKETIAINKNSESLIENQEWYKLLTKEQQNLVNQQNAVMGSAFDMGQQIAFVGEETMILNGRTRQLTATEMQLLRSNQQLTISQEGYIVSTGAATVATTTQTTAQKGLIATLYTSIAAYARAGIIARTFGLSLQGVTIAARAATIAVATLEAVLTAGIFLLVAAAIQWLTEKLMSFGDKTKDAKDNTEAYTKALDKNSDALNKNLQEIDYQTKKKKLLAEINGKSADEILKITQNGLEQEKQLYSKQIGDLQALRMKASRDAKLTAEERQKTLESIDKKILEASNNYVKKRNEIEFAGLERQKEVETKRREDTKTANDLLLEYQNSFAVLTAKNEREKQDKELQIAKKGEEDKIKLLQISDAKKLELLQQVNAKYVAITMQNNAKRNAEDIKASQEAFEKTKQFLKERDTVLIEAGEDEIKKAKQLREQKYNEDVAAMKANTEFLKLSMTDQADILIALKKKYNADIKKLDDDKRKQDNDDLIKKLDEELKFLQIANEAKREGTRAYFDGQRQLLDTAQKRELAQLDLTEDQKLKIKEKYVKLRKDLDRQELDSYLQMATAVLSAANNIVSDISEINQMQMEIDLQKAEGNAEKQEEIKKKYFEKNKKTQVAQAIIGTLQAAIQAYQSLAVIPVVGPALGAAAAAAALIFGYKKVNLIKQQQYQSSTEGTGGSAQVPMTNYGRNYERGGMINGPRHAQGGVMIEAEGGEAVMTRGAVTMFAPLLSAMNQMGGGTSFTKGAIGAARPDAPILNRPSENQAPLIMKTYVVENELTSIQQRQARLKDLSTL